MELKIYHLYPDILNLYGDRGNIIVLKQRCLWRGIHVDLVELGAGSDADFAAADLFFIGGGQDFDQHALLDDFGIGRSGSKADRFAQAVEAGVPCLAICGGYQLLGEYYAAADGTRIDFMGVLPAYTEAGENRLIGNLVYEASALPSCPMVLGFENHAGRTYLREGVHALGTVKTGYGNNGVDGLEGARVYNIFASYAHGPLLPKNPVFADELLSIALKRKYQDFELLPLDDSLEKAAADSMLSRLGIRV